MEKENIVKRRFVKFKCWVGVRRHHFIGVPTLFIAIVVFLSNPWIETVKIKVSGDKLDCILGSGNKLYFYVENEDQIYKSTLNEPKCEYYKSRYENKELTLYVKKYKRANSIQAIAHGEFTVFSTNWFLFIASAWWATLIWIVIVLLFKKVKNT